MGAVVAGTTHAPLTAMLILFEMTDDYQIILPLMLATVLSTLVAKRFEHESIYTMKLSRRGPRIAHGIDMSILDAIRVHEIMDPDCDFVRVQTPLGEIVSLLQRSELTDFPVVDEGGRLQGVVSFQDIRSVLTDEDLYPLLIAADVIEGHPTAVTEGSFLSEALAMFAESDVNNLPVVDNVEDHRLVGVITRSGLVRHYHLELQKRISAGET